MLDFKLLSADGHLTEPQAAWERAQKEFGDRAPRVVTDPEGMRKGVWMFVDGLPPVPMAPFQEGEVMNKPQGISAVATGEHEHTASFFEAFRYEDYPAGWDPDARIQQQDSDDIEAELLFASAGSAMYGLEDPLLQRSILRSYNAWLNEFCSTNPKRFFGVPYLSSLDAELAVADLEEYAKAGNRGVALPPGIKGGGYYEPQFEPFWALAEEAGVVVNFHTGTGQGDPPLAAAVNSPRAYDPVKSTVRTGRNMDRVQQLLGNLIFSGVLDRYPKLKIGIVEFDVGWMGFLVQRCDYLWGRTRTYDPERDINQLPPSEYMRKNFMFSFQDDRVGMLTIPFFGEDAYTWGSDYPHRGTTYPHSLAVVDNNLEGIDPAIQRKIGRDNLNKFYDLGL